MTSCVLTIGNPLGLHARAAARFVQSASGFSARIKVGRDGQQTDGKSIMGLLLLSASQGTVITIVADGPDEAAAIEALRDLVERGFEGAPFDGAQDGPCV